MDLLQQFKTHLRNKFSLPTGTEKLLIAVSGGVDSVVLAELFFRLECDFEIAHCNFQLRGAESERDEALVLSLEKKYDKQVHVKRFDTSAFADEQKLSVQEAARDLRYNWFKELCAERNLSRIVTAHHANDNAETVLMHLFRGTGLKGLIGIPEKQNNIIRPLLPFSKQQLIDYANRNGILFAEDSSNASNKYTRNFFRNEIIPAVEKVFPDAQNNLSDTIQHLKEAQAILNEAVEAKKKKLFTRIEKSEDVSVPVAALKQLNPLTTWIKEFFTSYGLRSRQVPELIKLLDSENGSCLLTDSHRIIKHKNRLIVSSSKSTTSSAIIIEEDQREVVVSGIELSIENIKTKGFKIPSNSNICCADKAQLQFPLILRRWKTGDYFYPLGMKKKKKLSRFFTDQKLSLLEKENIWVLESNKRIVWIVNHRMDDRFKITPSTQAILKIEARVL